MNWRQLEEFPNYSVSDTGLVRNDKTDRILSMSTNQEGVVYVGLSKDGIQYKRSVCRLVAKTFAEVRDFSPRHTTPINLDGDRSNNRVENLAWRPYWYAVEYFRQFDSEPEIKCGVVSIDTGERYPTSFDVVRKYGVLERKLFLSIFNREILWPTGQRFRLDN